jgi:hypothetical protein
MEDVKEEEKQKAPITETLEINSGPIPVTEFKPQQPVTTPTPKVFEIQKRDKVAIVGCAESKSMAPFNMPDTWEFWGVNNLHVTMPKQPWTRWFEMHSITYDNITYKRRGLTDFRGMLVQAYLESLNALNIPVYMQRPWNVIPHAVPYPLDAILKEFPRKYFTNTISWMIALAILEGFKEIGIWGVDMAVSSPLRAQNEYSHQRPSCEYFIGIAEGRGIKVHLPDECDLLKSRFLYAINEPEENAFNKKLANMQKSLQQRLNEADAKERMSNKQKEQYIGAISCLQEVGKIWGND